MSGLSADQARTLLTVVDSGTFDAAARALHITPSAVSQRIKALEASAGQVLIRRTVPVTTTPAGDVLLRFARQVELLASDAADALRLAEPGGVRSLPIAVNADSLATWFLDALAAVPTELGVVFDLQRDDEQHTSDLLRAGIVLGAVTGRPQAVQGCITDELGVMRYSAVCSPEFAERYVADLAHAPLVDFDHKDTLQSRFLREVGAGRARPPRHYVPTSHDYARAVRLGLGWGLLPEHQSERGLADGSLVELMPEHPIDVRLAWQRWNLSSPVLDAVTAAILDTAGRHLRRPDARSR